MTKIWGYIVAVFTFLIAAFFYEKDQKENAEVKADNAATRQEDAVLNKDTTDLQQQLQQEQVDVQKAKEAPVTQDDLLKFLNDTKKD